MGTRAAVAALFAVLGAAGAVVVAAVVQVGCLSHDAPVGPLVTILVPVAMSFVGAWIVGLATRLPWALWALVAEGSVLASGAMIGAVAGLPYGAEWGAVLGARDGFFIGSLAAIAGAPLFAFVRRFGCARPESLAARSHYLVTWAAGGLALTLSSTLAVVVHAPMPACGRASDPLEDLRLVAIVGVVVAVVAACRSAGAWYRGRAVCATPMEPNVGTCEVARRFDLGVGEGKWSKVVLRDPYRDARPVDLLVIGNPAATTRALWHDLTCAAFCTAGAIAFVAWGPLSRWTVP
ncbi:MAG TPA: hypothetical protein VKU41_20500 [Polyangiaceae bacterium]|nr:hypothetical protein [Polyangiaceae bacterium]